MTRKEASTAEDTAKEGMESTTNNDLTDHKEIVQEIRTEEMHPTNIIEDSDRLSDLRKSDDEGLNCQDI